MNTPWEPVSISKETAKYAQVSYFLWSRIADGERIYTFRHIADSPKEGDGGYMSAQAAIATKFAV